VKMMHEKSGMSLQHMCGDCDLFFTSGPFDPDNASESSIFQWKWFLDKAFHHHFRLIHWQDEIFPPGPNFNLRTITPAQLKAVTKVRIEKELNRDTDEFEFEFVPWSQGQSMLIINQWH
jgi:hypothetical protein